MKFKVDIQTFAFASIAVELSDEQLRKIATDLEKEVSELTIDDLREYVEDEAFKVRKPWLCNHCSGRDNHYLELSDNWEVPDDAPNTSEKYRSVRRVDRDDD